MALIDRVTERITNDLLVKLTNPDDAAQTTVNTTYLTRICDDAESEFPAYMNEEYDETVRVHILAAVQLVKLKCIEYGAAANIAYEKLRELTDKRLEMYRNVRARDRVAPQSSSQLEPSDEVADGQTVRPAFDDTYFQEIIPEHPEREPLE